MGADTWLSIMTLGLSNAFGWSVEDKNKDSMPEEQPLDTGAIGADEAKDIARKKLFREGTVFTSPSGLGGTGSSAGSRLK